jgi:DNA-binding transcriptional ArsR family regulator
MVMVEGFGIESGFDLDRFINKDWILTNREVIKELSQFYSVFSNPTRLQIMMLLMKKDRCVGEIAQTLNLDQSTVSSHLKMLRHLKLVKTKRHGRFVRYSIQNRHVRNVLKEGFKHILKYNG